MWRATSGQPLYQRLLDRVYPERLQNNRPVYRDRWWIFAEPRPAMRKALTGLERFITTPYTARHRPFIFVDGATLPDAMAYAITSDDAFVLGVLSSRVHVNWALSAGGRLGIGNDPRYTSTTTFAPFPFPTCDEPTKAGIRKLGEGLDSHRKRQQELHPDLTVTDMYNVLEKLRADEPLNDRDRVVHEAGLISVLKQIHDELDAAVFEAYGWPVTLTDEEILSRLVQANAVRGEEERTGLIRWLRPEYQKPSEGVAAAFGTDTGAPVPAAKKAAKLIWPKTIPEQARAVRQALASHVGAVTSKQLAKTFARPNLDRVEELLQTLVSLGQARETEAGHFVA